MTYADIFIKPKPNEFLSPNPQSRANTWIVKVQAVRYRKAGKISEEKVTRE